jgi:hypothetical protein
MGYAVGGKDPLNKRLVAYGVASKDWVSIETKY